MIKLAKGIDPVGTKFIIASMGEGGTVAGHEYRVIAVTGTSNHIPTADTVVHLEYNFEQRSVSPCAPFLQIPLEVFVERIALSVPRIMPVSKKDIFWK